MTILLLLAALFTPTADAVDVEAGRKLGSEPANVVVEAGRKWRSDGATATLGNSWT